MPLARGTGRFPQEGAVLSCTLYGQQKTTRARWSDMRLIRLFMRSHARSRNDMYIRRNQRIFSRRGSYRLRIVR